MQYYAAKCTRNAAKCSIMYKRVPSQRIDAFQSRKLVTWNSGKVL